jgi:hypothetical protein
MHPVHYFVHVPKTAGITVRTWLREVYAPDEVIFVYSGQIAEAADAWTFSREELLRRAHELPASLRVFFGHFAFDTEWLLHPACRALAFVRDPEARIVSWQRYVARSGATLGNALIAEVAARLNAGDSFATTWRSVGGIDELDNGIVRMFANITAPAGAVGEPELARAIANVERWFDFVGHVDSFDASMQRIAAILGRQYRARERQNVAPGGRSEQWSGASGSSADRDLLAACTRIDREFVRWIAARFAGPT